MFADSIYCNKTVSAVLIMQQKYANKQARTLKTSENLILFQCNRLHCL